MLENLFRGIMGVLAEAPQYNEFFATLNGVKIKKMQEKPFTLQDYFMSFYKEERDFGGLSGVKGNSKEGLNNGK